MAVSAETRIVPLVELRNPLVHGQPLAQEVLHPQQLSQQVVNHTNILAHPASRCRTIVSAKNHHALNAPPSRQMDNGNLLRAIHPRMAALRALVPRLVAMVASAESATNPLPNALVATQSAKIVAQTRRRGMLVCFLAFRAPDLFEADSFLQHHLAHANLANASAHNAVILMDATAMRIAATAAGKCRLLFSDISSGVLVTDFLHWVYTLARHTFPSFSIRAAGFAISFLKVGQSNLLIIHNNSKTWLRSY